MTYNAASFVSRELKEVKWWKISEKNRPSFAKEEAWAKGTLL